jgi:hypothetical protein
VNTGWRPRLPVGAASHCVKGSNQIASDLRFDLDPQAFLVSGLGTEADIACDGKG